MSLELLFDELITYRIISTSLSEDEIDQFISFMSIASRSHHTERDDFLKSNFPDLYTKLVHLFSRLYPSEDVSYEE